MQSISQPYIWRCFKEKKKENNEQTTAHDYFGTVPGKDMQTQAHAAVVQVQLLTQVGLDIS